MRRFVLSLAVPLVLWASTASAAIITYTNQAAWTAAVSGPILVEPFNNYGPQPHTGGSTVNGTISGNQFLDWVVVGGATTTGLVLPNPTPVMAVGGLWNTAPNGEGNGLLFTLSMTLGGTQTVGQIGPFNGFFGWTSTEQFNSFTISAGSNPGSAETYTLDNLSYAQALAAPQTPVPEPGTLALVGTGLAGLGLRLRKRLARR
jgi:hypothetical protein